MKPESHLTLGRQFVRQYLADVPGFCKFAFYLGAVEPDYQPVTYLRGWRIAHYRGHHYACSLSAVRNLIAWISANGVNDFVSCYKLGKLAHYMTDGFTWPHNLAFPGTMKEHMEYEADLNRRLFDEAPSLETRDKGIAPEDLYANYVSAHGRYMDLPFHDWKSDLAFTLETVGPTIAALAPVMAMRTIGMLRPQTVRTAR